jgi:hypothetical protein
MDPEADLIEILSNPPISARYLDYLLNMLYNQGEVNGRAISTTCSDAQARKVK